jgi:hypothetical protein
MLACVKLDCCSKRCGKTNFVRRRQLFPYTFFYYVSAKSCVDVVVRVFPVTSTGMTLRAVGCFETVERKQAGAVCSFGRLMMPNRSIVATTSGVVQMAVW